MKRNESGIVLIGIVIALAISMSVAFYFLQSVVLGLNKEVQQIVLTSKLDQYRNSILSALENGSTLGASIATSADLQSCLSDPTFDCPKNGAILPLVSPSSDFPATKFVLNPNFLDIGLNVKNASCSALECSQLQEPSMFCSGFGSSGSSCAARFVSRWVPLCAPAGPCIRPSILLRVDLEIGADLQGFVANPERFMIEKLIR